MITFLQCSAYLCIINKSNLLQSSSNLHFWTEVENCMQWFFPEKCIVNILGRFEKIEKKIFYDRKKLKQK